MRKRPEQCQQRRMAERKLRRANAAEREREGGREKVGEVPLTTAELRSSDVVEKSKRNGGAAKLREASTMAAARARFLRRRRLRLRV